MHTSLNENQQRHFRASTATSFDWESVVFDKDESKDGNAPPSVNVDVNATVRRRKRKRTPPNPSLKPLQSECEIEAEKRRFDAIQAERIVTAREYEHSCTPAVKLALVSFRRFFSTTPILHECAAKMHDKAEENNSLYSGRLVEWLFTHHSKDRVLVYFLLFDRVDTTDVPDVPQDTARKSKFFNTREELIAEATRQGREFPLSPDEWMEVDLAAEYKLMIDRVQKKRFDLFRRKAGGDKFPFVYTSIENGVTTYHYTDATVCHLAFFKWAECYRVFDFWKEHHREVSARVAALPREPVGNARMKQIRLFAYAHTYMKPHTTHRRHSKRVYLRRGLCNGDGGVGGGGKGDKMAGAKHHVYRIQYGLATESSNVDVACERAHIVPRHRMRKRVVTYE